MSSWGVHFRRPIRVTIPPEFADEAALLTYLGLSTRELRKIWYFRWRMYRQFQIAKGPNKVRMISAPDERLKYIQRKLADALAGLYQPRNPVHGFVAGKSVKTNALAHLKRRYIVNLDLKDFFPTITQMRVEGLLSALGVDTRVAEIISQICCNNGHLPQGSPSSPILSNMICFSLDKKMMRAAKEARCIYTRYADDITFSSHQPPTALFDGTLPQAGRLTLESLSPLLVNAVQASGFVIHPEKLHYADRNSRRMVTGLKVNQLLNVDRRYVRNIRAALHAIERHGIEEAQNSFTNLYGGKSHLAAHLQGKIAFLTHIKGQSDPVVRSITHRFNRCFPDRVLRLTPTPAEMLERSVWLVDNDATIDQGTAFFLEGVGLVTAAHCVEGTSEVEVYHPTKPSNKFAVRVLNCCKHRDLAILYHEIPSTEYYELRRSPKPAGQGAHLVAVGYPDYGPGDSLNCRPGVVSSLKVRSGVRMLEVTQMLTQGMSGGPVLDGNDQVVGIIHKGGPEEGRNFAIGLDVLDAWLKEL